MPDPDDDAPYGWQSDLPTFYGTHSDDICQRLRHFVRDAGTAQHEAWRTHVPTLQRECRELAERDALAAHYNAILEYQLPYDLRRSDLIILERAAIEGIAPKAPSIRCSATCETCAPTTPRARTGPSFRC